MDVGDPLKELNLTADEMGRLANAFRDDKFREMLRDYAQEISDPENRKRYEEEIKLLEQARGNSIEFIHPTPFRGLKTSVGGEQKCYINICSNEKIGKPEVKGAVLENGRGGQCWTLPHSLHPGRQTVGPTGNKYMIYDVIFHPDTLHIATKNKKCMDIVVDTAVKGIQKTFGVILDENNVREIKTKYKGTPEPCVIRKPIPGYKAKKPPEQPDPFAFPYPDVTRPQTKPSESPPKTNSTFQILPQKQREPTKPSYTVKYRSVIDLQDFRCSRDSAQSPRPKEIVITIDLPLLKSAGDTNLEVKERNLLLESKQPAYRLELPLAYPVDEENGEAKFNKQNRQLTVTLPVQPPRDAFDFCVTPAASVSDFQSGDEREDERIKVEEEGNTSENGECKIGEQDREKGGETRVEKCAGEERSEKKGEEQKTGELVNKCNQLENKSQEVKEEERGFLLQEKEEVNKKEVGQISTEKETTAIRLEASSKTGYQHISTSDEHVGFIEEEKEPNMTSALESTSKTMTNIFKNNMGVSEGDMDSSQMLVTGVTNASSRGDPIAVTLKQKEKDSAPDDLPGQQIFQTSEYDRKQPAALLRDIDADGDETVISDHSTSAGFIFQNKLMYELD